MIYAFLFLAFMLWLLLPLFIRFPNSWNPGFPIIWYSAGYFIFMFALQLAVRGHP